MARTTLWSRFSRGAESQAPVSNEVALRDIVSRYDVVEVVPAGPDHEPYMLVAERGDKQLTARTDEVSFAEMGTSSPSPFTSFMRQEYNGKLRGLEGLQVYDQMRKSDGAVGGVLRLMNTPVLGARWFVEPASDSDQDKKIAEFVWSCLTEYQSISWNQILYEAMLMVPFGYYMFEKVWDVRIIKGEMRVVWSKLAPRHPMDVKSWIKDSHGGPAGVIMYNGVEASDYYPGSNMGPNAAWASGTVGEAVAQNYVNPSLENEVFIPMSKLLVFSYQREGGDIQGISGLRQAYKHWYFIDQLYKIDAIQKERHGIGIPVIKLPMGFSEPDKKAADELGRNLRTNERAHVVLPPNWELLFAKLEGQPVDALKSIKQHIDMIRENVLGKFNGEGNNTTDDDQIMFMKASRYIASTLADTFNLYAIPQLVDYNFQRLPNGYPKLRARGLGEEEDLRTLSFTVRNLIGAGAIIPDDVLEAHFRGLLDLPPADMDTRRLTAQPQNPGEEEDDAGSKQRGQKAGMPRQTTAVGPNGLPRSNSGTDRSGGTS